jgi:hypothetical protein
MLRFLHVRLRRRGRRRAVPEPDAGDRSSGEDVVESRQELVDDSTSPGTPRLKTRNL